MTTEIDICNRTLLNLGIKKQISSLTQDSEEAQACNTYLHQLRDDLLRMAPWNCAFNFATLNLITAAPGTPENTSAATTTWQKGQPAPPWAYEYQYPVDCLRAQLIVPQFTTGFASGIPITTAVTGGSPNFWTGPPIKFKVAVDQFWAVVTATPNLPGVNYAVGDLITLFQQPQGLPPLGAPAVLKVTGIGGGGAITTVSPVSNVPNEMLSGSYFNNPQQYPFSQGSTTGSGTGAFFNCTVAGPADQRVILTNQEFAILGYCKQITDPNIMDTLFVEAWTSILGARLVMALSDDKDRKSFANMLVRTANDRISEARKADANESLTINDVTPDWIRVRGINLNDWALSPNQGWDWGSLFPTY
jgi:hypothetical protein